MCFIFSRMTLRWYFSDFVFDSCKVSLQFKWRFLLPFSFLPCEPFLDIMLHRLVPKRIFFDIFNRLVSRRILNSGQFCLINSCIFAQNQFLLTFSFQLLLMFSLFALYMSWLCYRYILCLEFEMSIKIVTYDMLLKIFEMRDFRYTFPTCQRRKTYLSIWRHFKSM